MKKYKICVIGGGPAGLTAAIYAARAGMSVVVLEKLSVGGTVSITPEIANYPGFTQVSGWELSEKMREQAATLGAEIIEDGAVKITNNVDLVSSDENITNNVDIINSVEKIIDGNKKLIETGGGEKILADAVILAMGAASKHLGIKNETELIGMGVSYCATCDGAFFKGKRVMVVGGASQAVADVKYLAPIAEKVYLVTEKSEGSLSNQVDFPNVEIIYNSVITDLAGSPLNAVTVRNGGKTTEYKVTGLFVAIGYVPQSYLVKDFIPVDERGYIIADESTKTSVKGFYVAGDIRTKPLRQIVTACSDGAVAATAAMRELKKSLK